jgi:NAD(P)-dependent dehydrogenase (short-subunit alcohol dehydrogenase family)
MKKLENRVAIITGGAGSIGKTTAKLFFEAGAKVVLVDLVEADLKKAIAQISAELGGETGGADIGKENIMYCVSDVTNAADVKQYVEKTVENYGKIDIFFNNAGIEGVVMPIIEYPEEEFDKVLAVNVKGTWLGNKYVLPHMNDGGSIIMTSSVSGLLGSPNVSAYITSKHAVVGIMRATAIEAAPRKIRVNSVHPSPVDNRMMRSFEDGFAAGHGEDVKKTLEASIPLGRYAEPVEVARLVLFLASDDSLFITGTTQVVDGGLCVQ